MVMGHCNQLDHCGDQLDRPDIRMDHCVDLTGLLW